MTLLYHLRPDRWPRVSLKGFFVLLTILGVVLGWPIHKAREQMVAVAALKEMGCSVRHGDSNSGAPTILERFRKLLGEAEFRNATKLFGAWSQISDAGLVHLEGLTQLDHLDLRGTQMSDASLVHLQQLVQLEWLDLAGMQVSDVGLVHLQGLTQLQNLYLAGTQATDAGAQQLWKFLPKCRIHGPWPSSANPAARQRCKPRVSTQQISQPLQRLTSENRTACDRC